MVRRDKDLPVIGGRGHHGNILSGKLCFELWVDRGTAPKATQVLANEYGLKGRNGKTYAIATVAVAARKWVLFNPVEAREIYEDKYGELEDVVWYEYLSRQSRAILPKISETRYNAWRDDNPEVVAYEQS